MTYKVAYIIGSLSSTSVNRKLVGAMIADAPEDLEFVEANFSQFPLYSPDLEADYPQVATELKRPMRSLLQALNTIARSPVV